MASTRIVAVVAASFVATLSLISSATLAAPRASADDTARVLAGLEPSAGSPLSSYTNEAFWKQHARNFNDAWTGLEARQLTKIRPLVAKNFNNPRSVLFYMFSGPDFLYADAFFPSADTYVMAGLEPPGIVPDLRKFSRGEMAGALHELKTSLNSVLSYSFFQTKFMSYDLRKTRMPGTLPVLMVFLARSGKTVYDVSLIDLKSDGSIHPAEEKIPNPTGRGAKIIFSDNVGKKRTIYYFSTDISNSGLKNSGFLTFCDKLGQGDSFVKSASYLMHSDNFSTIREFLLTHSMSLLEDDSGIPVRFFAEGWQLHPFGRYVGPIGLFAGQSQSKLHEIFSKGKATPIDFGVGYRWKPMESNLLYAVKDSTATAFSTVPPATVKKRFSEKLRVEANADAPKREPRVYRKRKEQTVSNPLSKMFGYSP
jgi:hypothetical protein